MGKAILDHFDTPQTDTLLNFSYRYHIPKLDRR